MKKFTFIKAVLIVGAVIGTWAVVCLANVIMKYGLVEALNSYKIAILGG